MRKNRNIKVSTEAEAVLLNKFFPNVNDNVSRFALVTILRDLETNFGSSSLKGHVLFEKKAASAACEVAQGKGDFKGRVSGGSGADKKTGDSNRPDVSHGDGLDDEIEDDPNSLYCAFD